MPLVPWLTARPKAYAENPGILARSKPPTRPAGQTTPDLCQKTPDHGAGSRGQQSMPVKQLSHWHALPYCRAQAAPTAAWEPTGHLPPIPRSEALTGPTRAEQHSPVDMSNYVLPTPTRWLVSMTPPMTSHPGPPYATTDLRLTKPVLRGKNMQKTRTSHDEKALPKRQQHEPSCFQLGHEVGVTSRICQASCPVKRGNHHDPT